MQKNLPIALHKVPRIFSKFCADMSMLPPQTPVFLIDTGGRIVEKKNLKNSEAFENIVAVTDTRDRALLIHSHYDCDAFAVRSGDGGGKDFIVVSKDSYGFSRCVVCSVSENGCVKLHDYYEKLACYKDYLDSFVSLVFSTDARVPVLRLFKMRLSGVTELMRLSEQGGAGRRFSFPLKPALEKIASVARVMDGSGATQMPSDGIPGDVTVNAPEGFFKLMLSVSALLLRCSADGCVKVASQTTHDEKRVRLFMSAKGKPDSSMYVDALVRAFERTGIECSLEVSGESMSFSCELAAGGKRAEIVSDSAEFDLRIERMLSDENVLNLYRTVADITEI